MAALAICAAARPAVAQRADSAAMHGAVVTASDALVLAAAGGSAALLFGADRRIADGARDSWLHTASAPHGVLTAARLYGDPGSVVLGAGLWALGEARGDRTTRLLGERSLEAVVASGVVTGAIKMLAGRARPDASPDDATSFAFGRGFRGGAYQSFPSGHTTAAFAFASAVDAEWARLDGGRPRWIAPALYALAGLTGVERVADSAHWTSDVVFGAAIGWVSGRAVARWHADRP